MNELKSIRISEFIKLKSKELILLLEQARGLILRHNQSVGYIGEEIIRRFLNNILPKQFRATQGFIESNGQLSPQCDIIIFDQINYAPLYSFGNIDVISIESVVSVIEIKSTISSSRFCGQLNHFEKIHELGADCKHLFIFNGPRPGIFDDWLHNPKAPAIMRFNNQNDTSCDLTTCTNNGAYDIDDYMLLPSSILVLDKGYCLQKAQIQNNKDDYYGYAAYSLSDCDDIEISCLQIFIQLIFNDVETFKKSKDYVSQGHEYIQSSYSTNGVTSLTILQSFPICSI